jgi:hypothetical protein
LLPLVCGTPQATTAAASGGERKGKKERKDLWPLISRINNLGERLEAATIYWEGKKQFMQQHITKQQTISTAKQK